MSNYVEVMGVKGKMILRHAKEDGIVCLSSKNTQSGQPIVLVKKAYIESLVLEYTSSPGEEVLINGEIYVGILQKMEFAGMIGATILDNIKRDKVEMIQGKQPKNGRQITLVPKKYIDSLSNTCDAGEEKIIHEQVYI
jgi:hypothetical protein